MILPNTSTINPLRPLLLGILVSMLCYIGNSNASEIEHHRFCGTHWPPFAYAKDGKIVAGISYELYREVFKRLKWSVVMDVIPWPRCIKWVEKGKYSAGMDSVPRMGSIHGKNPTAFFPLAIYVRRDFPQKHFSWELMNGKLVGMVNGYVYTDLVRSFKGWRVHRTKDEGHLVKMLDANHLDFVLLDLFSAPIVSKNIDTTIRRLTPIVDSALLYPLFNSELQPQMLLFDRVLRELIDQGVVESIFLKHLPYGYAELLKQSQLKLPR